MPEWEEVASPISLSDHSARHEDGGADEISIKDLSGEPKAINDMMTYYDTIVTYEGKVLTRGT